MLRSSLKKINGDELLAEAGIAPESRPQDIDIEGFCKLANLYELANKTAY
jgi:16S rRNA A1518/A1519 N6-dimethyltransferase RsmA/KsgA/DIM1 with predicted DNA glycosylase/AP lyase activity